MVLKGLYKGATLNQLEWDLATVTAADYSVEMEIDVEAYTVWYN